jgi:DNA-directed RNA polymerase subunit F
MGKVATSSQKVATSDRKVATSNQKVATSGQKVATTKRHYSKEELRKKILDYCAEWRTLDDISSFIERDRNYLRNKVLPRMTDVIEKMYENIPNHPRQKYRARQNDQV